MAQDNRTLRGLDAVGLPILTLDGDLVCANAAARALADDCAFVAIAQDAAHAQAMDGTGALVTLPSGKAMHAICGVASDGLEDILLVSPHALGFEVKAPHVTDFEEIPVALLQLDSEGRIAGTNRLARSLLALSADETRYFWQIVEGLGRPVADWLADAQAGRALGRPEVLRASLAGVETYVQIILRRVGASGEKGNLVAVISDATELKSLEARFVQSQKMQAIGQLAGGVAHDFNNLLTAISGHCDLLLINRDRFHPDYDDLLQIHQNANRAAALVRQLLAFSRKQTMKPETLSLESLLEELTHLLTRLVGERINLELSHDPALTSIRADRRQLEQVIINLVVNARDAMPMGGTIRVETEAQQFDAELEIGRARIPAGEYAIIRVIDQGVGIPASNMDKIFEPFFTTKRLGEGTGLGLSTAYGIVKQMGGYIFAQSVEGSGTVFTLYFASATAAERTEETPHQERHAEPRHTEQSDSTTEAEHARSDERLPEIIDHAPAPTPIEPARTPPVQTLRGGTILLVEDEAPVRAFAARALRLQGYQVFEAQDGEQALEFLEDQALRIDLFVTDVIMPGIDGPGWVSQALIDRQGTPVVFVSGYTEDTLSEALSRIPHALFLGKPFSLHDLCDAIDTQLVA
ncbi:ATP-binding protein [Pararhodobacter sp.]|uniref:hybrid sensor histidine kinase/response regulator n=1 Tax=Pararhodobacter sp. TaxID=2127056 RepID=UPI002AFFF8CE|nr:ATP-binding protein [Pararhodobacter sp.]